MGCHTSVGLHCIPQNLEIRRQWLRVIGVGENSELPPHAGVCRKHFTQDAFANFMEHEQGFATRFLLKSEAVPTLDLPRLSQKPPTLLPRKHEDSGPQPKTTCDVGCQTDPVIIEQECVQANVKPTMQSKATQAEAPDYSVSCDTEYLITVPLPESPPLKRKRHELSDTDPSIHLESSASSLDCISTPIQVPAHLQKKYIVHEEQLLGLFRSCPFCTRRCVVDTMTVGTLLQVKQQCTHCEFLNHWSSQPMVNSIPAGDLQLCAAVLFTGSSFSEISKFMRAFNVQGLSEQSFYRHQANLLIPTVSWQWKLEQDQLIREAMDGEAVTLGGGMRADSPGRSAKYGSYTMMDLQCNKVIDIQLVQRNEVGNGVQMQKEGFVRSLNVLEERGVKVHSIVTDRHTGVQKYLREEKKEIVHFFDPWHMGKGVGKKMDELGKKGGTEDVALWRKSVVKHLYWSASTSSSGQEALAKWTSVANHVQNVHTHNNALFPRCLHEPLVGEDSTHWLKPSTAACEKLTAMLLAPQFLEDVEKISLQFHTSTIEAFHSLILKFLPKSVGYSFKEMLSRLYIAALHYNENALRSHATTATGELRFAVVDPKYKPGDYTVRALKTRPTSDYVNKLMVLLFEWVVEDAVPYQHFADRIPVPEPLVPEPLVSSSRGRTNRRL